MVVLEAVAVGTPLMVRMESAEKPMLLVTVLEGSPEGRSICAASFLGAAAVEADTAATVRLEDHRQKHNGGTVALGVLAVEL